MGKMPQVLPYSGAMLAIVARSGERQVGEAVAEELDELVDHAFLAQHLGDREHEIGGRAAGLHRARHLEADDLRNEHR